jgi:hypothetical protein
VKRKFEVVQLIPISERVVSQELTGSFSFVRRSC